MNKKYGTKTAGHSADYAGLCVWICVLFMCVLCGCTKREQLLLEADGERPVVLQSGESDADETAKEDGTGTDGQVPRGEYQAAVSDSRAPADDTKASEIYVHICGAVNHPGVFALPEGSRVFDAVEAAGGFAEDASVDYMNQAQTVTDGCRIRIPTEEEVQSIAKVQDDPDAEAFLIQEDAGRRAEPGGSSADTAGKVNINEADAAQLCTVNGIGEGRAAAIIKYRETHGGFKSIEEIMNVTGIKQGTFDKIKEQITVK